MKECIHSAIEILLLRGAFYLLVAIWVKPLALAKQDNQSSQLPIGLGQSESLALVGSVLTPDLTPWSVVAPYPLVIEELAVASDGTYAYAGTGLSTGGITNAFYRYDPVVNTWTALPNAPVALYAARAVYAANTNSIYTFGGYDGNTAFDTTQIYNIATNTWSMGAAMPAGRFYPGVTYYPGNGKIYVIGGLNGSYIETSQTWEYDPVTNTWDTSRAPIPMPIGGSGSSIVGQYIYLAGGWNNGAASTTHYRYDIVGNSWALMTAVPVAIYEPAAVAVGTQTFLVGGGDPFLSHIGSLGVRKQALLTAPATSYNSTYIYDSLANTWTSGPNTNERHSFTAGAAIGARLLVVAGYAGFGHGDTNVVETALVEGGATPTPTVSPTPTPTLAPSPTPTPTPCIGRCGPTPRPRVTPAPRP